MQGLPWKGQAIDMLDATFIMDAGGILPPFKPNPEMQTPALDRTRKDPVLLGLVVNDVKRTVLEWERRGGTCRRPPR
jgi:hypothetical protein